MPKMQDAHIDRALTNMSVAYLQDASVFIADKVFPIVPVKRQSDVYYTYDKGDFMRDEAQERGAGTQSAGGDYGVEAGDPYYCKKYAFHKDVTTEERSNYDEPLDADSDATDFVTQKMLIKREKAWADKYFVDGIWGTDVDGAAATNYSSDEAMYWDDDDSDPVKDIAHYAVVMSGGTGYKPNVLVLSPYVFTALKNHPKILDRIKYTQKGIVTNDLLATLFEVDKVLTTWAVINSAVKGATDAIDFITGKHAFLCYANPRPALKKPSAGYIFAWTGLEGAGMFGNRMVRLPMDILGLGTERLEGEIAFDCKTICLDLGVFFKDIVE
jgi:hypothetical protein